MSGKDSTDCIPEADSFGSMSEGQNDSDSSNGVSCDSESEWTPGSSSASSSHVSESEFSDSSVVYPALTVLGCSRAGESNQNLSETTNVHSSTSYSILNVESTAGINMSSVKGSKRHCCKFCEKMNTKMSTHLMRCHANEYEVAQILKMKKGDPNRRKAFIRLQDEGDYNYNCRVLKDKQGNLIPKYRSLSSKTSESDFRACLYCKAIYRKHLISKHTANCSQRPDSAKPLRKGQSSQMGRLLLPIPDGVHSDFFKSVLSKLTNDDIGRIVMSDSLILQYGERLFFKRDCEEHTYGQINSRLRELGRLCKVLRDKSALTCSNLTKAVDPKNFDLLVTSVRELGLLSPVTNMYGKGSLAMRLGYSLKKCVQILKAHAIKVDDGEARDKCERFEALFTADWSDRISSGASQSVQKARMNKTKLLPSVSDVEKVNELLQKDMKSNSYVTLAKATLAAITIFNRKRDGDVQRMKLSDYNASKLISKNPPEEELISDLTETEKKLIDLFHRVEIRGKFNRPVPILLTPSMVDSLERLIVMRTLLDIDSPYLFITATGVRPYRGPRVLQDYAAAAKVTDPSLFTATTLRKQLATLSQAMAISELNQDNLATFLGHDLRIHRAIYRQTLDVVQKTKVASFLLKVNKGVDVSKLDFDDVNVEEEEMETITKDNDTHFDSDREDDDEDMYDPKVPGPSDFCHTGNPDTSYSITSNADCQTPSTTAKAKSSTRPNSTPLSKAKHKKRICKKKPWTEDEAKAVKKHLSHCFITNRVPQKHECQEALASEPILRSRKWTDIKFFVYNLLKKQR